MLEPKDQIKQKLDIAEVIGEYIQLKPAGSGSLKGLCPFHGEKTPSFHVSRERQMWHCFGCDKGGDMFAFVMDMDGLSFPEALRALGKRAGVEIPEYRPTPATTKRDRLIAMHDLAAKWYAKFLHEHPEANAAREYLDRRGIGAGLVEKFRLGAAPDRWDALVRFLSTKGFRDDEMLEGGLGLKRKSGTGLVDRFRNRVMIPLSDASGNVVGFTARLLPAPPNPLNPPNPPDQGPKYLNSPETPIYHKGDMLYGLHLAKAGMRSAKEVIIVEGNLDVIASHKAGVENVVGSSGTALTESQLRTLARYTKRLVFALDEDAAGFGAAQRVFELAMTLQSSDPSLRFDIRCLLIPQGAGKDPDDVVQKDPEVWRSVSSTSVEVVEYFFTKKLRDFEQGAGAASIDERTKLVDELLPRVARIERPDQRHLYLLRIADATHIALGLLEDMMGKQKGERRDVGERRELGTRAPSPIAHTPSTKLDKAAGFLLGLALKHQAFVPEALGAVPVDMLTNAPLVALYRGLNVVYTPNESSAPGTRNVLYMRLRAWLEEQGMARETSLLDALTLRTDELLAGLSPKEVRAEADRNIAIAQSAEHTARRMALESAIREAELSGDDPRLAELLREYSSSLTQPKA